MFHCESMSAIAKVSFPRGCCPCRTAQSHSKLQWRARRVVSAPLPAGWIAWCWTQDDLAMLLLGQRHSLHTAPKHGRGGHTTACAQKGLWQALPECVQTSSAQDVNFYAPQLSGPCYYPMCFLSRQKHQLLLIPLSRLSLQPHSLRHLCFYFLFAYFLLSSSFVCVIQHCRVVFPSAPDVWQRWVRSIACSAQHPVSERRQKSVLWGV